MKNELAKLPATTEVGTQSTAELKQRLASLLARTADDLREMASIVGELESRGEDLSSLRLGIVDHLRRIASGQLLPEIVVHFSGFPQMLRIASQLPLPDQKKLADGGSIDLAVYREGEVEWRRLDPLALTRDQVTQVFAGDRIRTQPEQVAILEDRIARPGRKKPKAARGAGIRTDRERGVLLLGRTAFTPEEILHALSEMRDVTAGDDEPDDATLVVKLRASEHKRLKVRAAESGRDMSDLVRRALRASGLL